MKIHPLLILAIGFGDTGGGGGVGNRFDMQTVRYNAKISKGFGFFCFKDILQI